MKATLGQFRDHVMAGSSSRRSLEAEYAAAEFVRFYGMSARPDLEEIKGLLAEIGAGSIVARRLPDGLRGAHVPTADGGYVIHHLPDDWRGGIEHTLLHETYEIIHETQGEGYGGPETIARVCNEADRFAAAVLMQREPFEVFAMATGLDVIALRGQFQRSYRSVALRLGEVMSHQPLLAVLYERREQGDPSSWCSAPEPSDFRASVVVRTPGFGVRGSPTLCGVRGGMPRWGSVPYIGSMAARLSLAGGFGYAEEEPAGGDGNVAVAARAVTWYSRIAKVAVVAVPYGDRHVLSPQLTGLARSRSGRARSRRQVSGYGEARPRGAPAGDECAEGRGAAA